MAGSGRIHAHSAADVLANNRTLPPGKCSRFGKRQHRDNYPDQTTDAVRHAYLHTLVI
jgi:hypothetical protein